MKVLNQATEMIRARSEIPCTGCQYCVPDCPQRIRIPDYFDLYNNYHRIVNTGYMSNQNLYYNALALGYGKASDCAECGQCEENCPQHIEIRKMLKKVVGTFGS